MFSWIELSAVQLNAVGFTCMITNCTDIRYFSPLLGCSLTFLHLVWSRQPWPAPRNSSTAAHLHTDPHPEVRPRPFSRLASSLSPVYKTGFIERAVFPQTSRSLIQTEAPDPRTDRALPPARTHATDTGTDESSLPLLNPTSRNRPNRTTYPLRHSRAFFYIVYLWLLVCFSLFCIWVFLWFLGSLCFLLYERLYFVFVPH